MAAAASTLTNVADLIKMFTTTGGGTTTQTSTESTSVTPEAIQAAIQKALEGNSGLAAISNGQKSAGVYNSTVQTQLVNDLMTRAASEALAKSSTKTATTTKVDSGTAGALASPTALGSLAAIQALSKDGGVMSVLDKVGKAKSLTDLFSNTADTAGVAASAADVSAAVGSSDFVSNINDGASFGDYLFSSDVAGTASAAADTAISALDTASTAMDSYDAGVTAADAMGTASDSGGFVDTVTDWYDNAKDWVSSWW